MFTISVVLEERNADGDLREYHKHEVTDPQSAFRFSAYLRTFPDVERDIQEAAHRARPFFVKRMDEAPTEPEPAEPEPETSDRAARSALYCSFCGKSQHEVHKLISGPQIFICNECVVLCLEILKEQAPDALELPRTKNRAPPAAAPLGVEAGACAPKIIDRAAPQRRSAERHR